MSLRVVSRAARRAGQALATLLLSPIYLLGGLIPRRRSLVAFGGNGDRFTDNARYLFLAALARGLDVVWITGRREVCDEVRAAGGRAALRWSPRGVATAARAGWFVYGSYLSDVNFWLSRGATALNLWHGIPLKAIEFDITTKPLAAVYHSPKWSPVRLAFIDRFRTPDYLVSTSPFVTERCFASAFRISEKRCLEVGYPRTDHLFLPDARERALAAAGISDRTPAPTAVVGYFPTWRDDGRDFLADAGFSFDAFNEALAATGRLLLFKAHPNFGDIVPAGAQWSNIVVLDPRVDLNLVLAACDVLVTDYSSVAFDFLLLDRPIVYFLPDHEQYRRRRNLYFSLDDIVVGPMVTDPEELYALAARHPLEAADARADSLRQKVWGGYRGDAASRLVDFVTSAGEDASGVKL